MKKVFTLILLSLIAFNAIHAEITWTLSDDGTLTISGTDMPDYSNRTPWYFQQAKIKKIVIENGVTSIGLLAFSNCSSLTSVNVGNTVTSIGDYAFTGCTSLTSINIPNSVTSIGDYAFSECTSLTSINIPNSVTSIGDHAFCECTGLTSINIPNSVTSIGKGTLQNCSGLIFINIPNSVTSIGTGAFYGCSGLTSINIPNSVTNIGGHAFERCSSLTSVTIPNSVTSIEEGTFRSCSGLIYVSIPNSVTSIGERVFSNCNVLTSLTIPSSVENIEWHAFDGCNLMNLVYNAKNLNSQVLPTSLRNLVIGDKLTSIGDCAFEKCKLQTLTIGTNVTSIGSSIFGRNPKPKKVIWLPNTPPSGYANASGNINYVSNENYKMSNTKVYKHLSSMFEVDGIKYVPVSPSERTCDVIDCNYDKTTEIVKISDIVFYKDIGMTILNINPYACYGNESIKNLNINYNGKVGESAFEECKGIEIVTLGKNITSIEDYAFYGCVAIKEIKIPDGITSVGEYGFSGCSSLEKVVFEDCPTTICANAFEKCSSLTELHLGKNVKTIGKYTFANCSSLTKISVPNSTTSIGDFAFSGCKSLADVTIEDRPQSISLGSNGSSPLFADCPISSVYLGGKLSYNTSSNSGYSPFYRNKNLQSVVITDTEELIYDNEFYGCTNLKSVKIGDGVKSIGDWAFSGCASLESFSFGKSMQSIGKEAFSDCTNMKSIISYVATAPQCGSQALDDIDKWACILTVPYNSLASYQNADQWKEFFFIQEAEPNNQTTGIEELEFAKRYNIYDLNGRKITNSILKSGLYIKNGKKYAK